MVNVSHLKTFCEDENADIGVSWQGTKYLPVWWAKKSEMTSCC